MSFINKILTFTNEVTAELKKVSWPKRDELVGSVIIVCFVTLVFAAILGSMDFGFSYVIKQFIL